LISIGLSTFVIVVLVFALVLVLGRLFFEPLAGAMEERQGRIVAAEKIRAETARKIEEILARHREAMNRAWEESYEILEKARAEGKAKADSYFGAERARSLERLEAARQQLRQQADGALRTIEAEAERLAGEIASRILGRKVA
jgi:F-type H+-transporting ATPase subunit b